MITAKTESGFEIELDDEAMNDVELVEAIVEMDTDGTKLFYVADRLLGKEGKKKLYDHLRDAKGRVPVAAFGAAIGELIRSFFCRKKLCILAELIASDEDALICDFAQYYHVLDWRSLPLRLAATLAAGLPESSRSMLRLAGQRVSIEDQLQASAADTLNRIEWWLMGKPGGGPPKSILEALTGTDSGSDTEDVQSFASPEEFEAAIAALKGG